MAHDAGICNPEIDAILSKIESKGQSLAVLGHTPHEGCSGKILGIIAIAKQAGIGDLMPDQKVEHVRKLVAQYTHVGMIGDGVNDTPALAIASAVFAVAIKAVFLILAFMGIAGLWLAILADTGATLLVILNSLRLLAGNSGNEYAENGS